MSRIQSYDHTFLQRRLGNVVYVLVIYEPSFLKNPLTRRKNEWILGQIISIFQIHAITSSTSAFLVIYSLVPSYITLFFHPSLTLNLSHDRAIQPFTSLSPSAIELILSRTSLALSSLGRPPVSLHNAYPHFTNQLSSFLLTLLVSVLPPSLNSNGKHQMPTQHRGMLMSSKSLLYISFLSLK